MISKDEVARVAYLARISLNDEEAKALSQQLSFVLEHFEQVRKVNTEGVEPMVTPSVVATHWREDRVSPADAVGLATANAPETVGNLFKVPPVVG